MQIEIAVEYDKGRNASWVRYEYDIKLYMDYLNKHEDARWAIDMILVKIFLCILSGRG